VLFDESTVGAAVFEGIEEGIESDAAELLEEILGLADVDESARDDVGS